MSTADPADFSVYSALEKFCTNAGDVLHASSSVGAKASSTVLTGGGNGNGNTGTPGAVPVPSTAAATATATAGGGGAVTVTAGGASASPTVRASGGSELLVNWALGMGSVAFAVVVFL